jgi:hypothetical protein
MTETASIHPKHLSYWDKVAVLRATDNQEYIAFILETEEEDDFRAAIADNPNATVEHIRWAAAHHAGWVRARVIANPKTPTDVLLTIVNDAYKEILEHEEEARTVSPMKSYHLNMVDQNSGLVAEALAVLMERMAPSA